MEMTQDVRTDLDNLEEWYVNPSCQCYGQKEFRKTTPTSKKKAL